MGKGGQYQRLLLAFVILLGEIGAYLLLGALAVGVILAQILLLALLAFAPVALLVGIFPGRGHEFFRKWLGKLAGYLARKVIYSLILAVVLAVCSALDNATSNLGWLLAFSLQAAFLWTIFLQRKKLTDDLLSGTVGHHGEDGNRLANLYFASRLARMVPTPGLPSIPSLPRLPKLPHLPWPKSGGGSESPSGERPGGGAPPPPPPAGGSPPPPPPSGGPAGAGGGGEAGGETYLPPTPPSPHETPTHGPGSPPPSTGGSGDESRRGPTVGEAGTPPHGGPAAPPRRATLRSRHQRTRAASRPEDELPSAETLASAHPLGHARWFAARSPTREDRGAGAAARAIERHLYRRCDQRACAQHARVEHPRRRYRRQARRLPPATAPSPPPAPSTTPAPQRPRCPRQEPRGSPRTTTRSARNPRLPRRPPTALRCGEAGHEPQRRHAAGRRGTEPDPRASRAAPQSAAKQPTN